MDDSKKSIDYTANIQLYFAIVLSVYIVYLAKDIMLPFIFSIIVAILLNPLVNFLTRKNINRVIAIILVLILAITLLGGIFFFIGYEVSIFTDTIPLWKEKFNLLINDTLSWVSYTFNVSSVNVQKWISQFTDRGLTNSTAIIRNTLSTAVQTMVTLLLIPVFIFLLLLYKDRILVVISSLFSERKSLVDEVLKESKFLIQHYLLGLLIELAIFATLSSSLLLMLGIEHAVMFGVISALLNMIPYIGAFGGMALAASFALIMHSPSSALFVVIGYQIIQSIDNHFVVPKIVASKVRVNALASIIVVLTGGEIFGVAGMFLAIPLTAIVKVVCDRIDRFKPVGLLLGDDPHPLIGKSQKKPRPPKKIKK
jgi:predicted PurR-regulated permease PerM